MSDRLKHINGHHAAVMTKPNKTPQTSPAPSYPDKTTGSDAAASVRKQANNWSEETRAKLFEQGMQIIYGGPGPSAKIRS
jgi:hypothetical protein